MGLVTLLLVSGESRPLRASMAGSPEEGKEESRSSQDQVNL